MTRISRRSFLAAGAAATGLAALHPAVAMAAPGRTPARPLAFLNHTYMTLDRATADAVDASDYLHGFGDFLLKTTTNSQITYTGRYLRGRSTYLEMFRDGDPGFTLGDSGIAHSPDRAGGLDAVKQRLIGLGVKDPVDGVESKVIDGRSVPWFREIYTSDVPQKCSPWAMEYLESYFEDPGVTAEPASFPGDVSRERYNPDLYRTKMMRDVVAVELGVPQADLHAVTVLLEACGLQVRRPATGLIAIGCEETVTVRVVPVEQAGWRRIGMVLNRPARGRHVERLGTSCLVVGPGPHAVWTFGDAATARQPRTGFSGS